MLNSFLSSYQDSLAGSFSISSGSGFTFPGGTLNLASDPSNTNNAALVASFDTSQAAAIYQEVLTYTPTSHNASGDTPLTPITLELDATIAPAVSDTSYSLTASAGSTNLLLNASTSVSATINNTGSAGQDSLNYTGLTLSNAALLRLPRCQKMVGLWPPAARTALGHLHCHHLRQHDF